jgi:hypothetical protein
MQQKIKRIDELIARSGIINGNQALSIEFLNQGVNDVKVNNVLILAGNSWSPQVVPNTLDVSDYNIVFSSNDTAKNQLIIIRSVCV